MHHFLSSLEESNHSCSGVELLRASIASERHITIHGRDYEWQSTKMPSANLHNLILGVGEVGIAHPTPIEELVPPVDLPDPKPCICHLHTPGSTESDSPQKPLLSPRPLKKKLTKHHSAHVRDKDPYAKHSMWSSLYCESVFSKKSQLKMHLTANHPENRAYCCTECASRFNDPQSVQCHHAKVHPVNLLICAFPDCDFQTPYKYKLNKHLYTHQQDKALSCPILACGKAIASKDSLKIHMATHCEDDVWCPKCL